MTHGSLFSGIGGFDLAAEWAGWENIFHCEINTFGRRVFKYYWPNSISYDDITKTDFTIHRGTIDVLTGGFPCQPFSLAGKRLGTADHRNLWPEYHRVIREIQPTWVVGENVPGLLNWSGGLVFEQVQADLENEGYEVWPVILPACGVNAPHRRDRVWFVAYNSNARIESTQRSGKNGIHEVVITPNPRLFGQEKRQFEPVGPEQLCEERPTPNPDSDGHQLRGLDQDRSTESQGEGDEQERERVWDNDRGIVKSGNATDTNSERRQECDNAGKSEQQGRFNGSFPSSENWSNFPTQPPVHRRNDGLSSRLVGITVPKHRNESIKAYGNSVVVQVVYQILKAIQKYEDESKI